MTNESLRLVEPSLELVTAFVDFVADHRQAGEERYADLAAQADVEAYVRRCQEEAQGLNLAPGIVPQTTYWLVQGDFILGESRLRHELTPALEREGGNIGCIIRPSKRRKGYGTLILALTLAEARRRGMSRVCVTVDADNTASTRVIEKNAGSLPGQAVSGESGKVVSQYWIEFTSQER